MKNTNTHLRNILSAIAVFATLAVGSSSAMANTEKRTKKSVPVEMKYVGSNYQSPVLELSFENASEEDLTIIIRDLDGNTLYTETSSDSKYVKKFQFDNYSIEPIQIKVTVASKKGSTTETFEVARKSQVVEAVVINKL
ncbi:hypothetical protein [Flavihumibacter sp. ZG627]|uniref:hypothetical protein n=1 Tax=Flavihumibacter sp. ZG627 TaxID=1463156 RepID=UPI00057E6A30|nr:hypothetical protein [Flavihumibacter sp. ZG627]KIC90486.1 hypothetical protein HY58_11060 [Flavihumibacter sp. ZG627]